MALGQNFPEHELPQKHQLFGPRKVHLNSQALQKLPTTSGRIDFDKGQRKGAETIASSNLNLMPIEKNGLRGKAADWLSDGLRNGE